MNGYKNSSLGRVLWNSFSPTVDFGFANGTIDPNEPIGVRSFQGRVADMMGQNGPTAQRPNGPTAQRPNGPTAQDCALRRGSRLSRPSPLFAAGLKGYRLASDRLSGTGLLDSRGFLILVAEFRRTGTPVRLFPCHADSETPYLQPRRPPSERSRLSRTTDGPVGATSCGWFGPIHTKPVHGYNR